MARVTVVSFFFASLFSGLVACGGSVEEPPSPSEAASPPATSPSQAPIPASPSPSLEGTIEGVKLQGRGVALKQFFYDAAPDERYGAASLAIADVPSLCTASRATDRPVVLVSLRSLSRAKTVSPDTYRVGAVAAPQATIQVVRLHDGDCGHDVVDVATTGTVRIDLGKPRRLEGSFEAVLEKNGAIRGRFEVDACEDVPVEDDRSIRCAL